MLLLYFIIDGLFIYTNQAEGEERQSNNNGGGGSRVSPPFSSAAAAQAIRRSIITRTRPVNGPPRLRGGAIGSARQARRAGERGAARGLRGAVEEVLGMRKRARMCLRPVQPAFICSNRKG